MTKLIPEEKIREVRDAADIVEVVSESVMLKKAGKDLVGLCPFHSEKTPSFTVNPDKQVYYCFGCSEGGDVIGFVMKQEGFSYPEAVKKLAARYGVHIPEGPLSPGQKRAATERETLLGVNREAAAFFRHCLNEARTGRRAMEYLAGRGMGRNVIRDYGLGYAPDSWDALVRHLSQKRLPAGLVEKAGLIVPRKTGRGHYDRFRNRIIFPIMNRERTVIGFGGRVLDDSLPKYLNSPETPLYNKSRSLYGIDRARRACRSEGRVFIVEGYFDLLALHQNGFLNSVATLGTSLTPDHVRVIRSLVGDHGLAVLVYDSDTAGIKAARRSIEVFDRGKLDAHILVLPTGHDPDSYLAAFGAAAFGKLATEARGIIPFLLESAIAELGLSLEARVRILDGLSAHLAAVGDKVARSLYIREVAERLDVDESVVLEKVRGASTAGGESARVPGSGENRVERQLVAMMLAFPEAAAEMERLQALDLLEDGKLKALGREILRINARESGDVNDMIGRLTDNGQGGLAASLVIGERNWDEEKCLITIRRFAERRRKRRDSDLIDRQIRAAEKNDDQELCIQLLAKKQQLAVASEKRKMSLLKKW